MKTFWESLLLNVFRIGVIIIAIIITIWWLTVPTEDFEEEDPFSVTITYLCKEVMADPEDEDIPEHVLSECKKLAKELQNGTKPNKPII